MKTVIIFIISFFTACFALAQDQTKVWMNGGEGNIHKLNINNGTFQFYCATGKPFLDIALTPDGRLWGNTPDSLFQIYFNGNVRPIGKVHLGKALVGLDNTTLLIDSANYLLAMSTANASRRMVGYIKYHADGDLTWMGDDLYMVSSGRLVKIALNDDFSAIERVDSLLLDSLRFTAGLTTAYMYNGGYNLIAPAIDGKVYRIDTANGNYIEVYNSPPAVFADGASSMVFPLNHTPSSVKGNYHNPLQIEVYPNPAGDHVFIELKNFNGKKSEAKILLYDLTGVQLHQQSMELSGAIIELERYTPGLYILEFQYQGRTMCRRKIIKS